MARSCSICARNDRAKIDVALAAGSSTRTVAGQYGATKSAVQRHLRHIAPALQAAGDQVLLESAVAIRAELQRLHERTGRLLDKAEAAEDLRGALAAIREARGVLEAAVRLFVTVDVENRLEKLEKLKGVSDHEDS